jgi:hypothetical protein
VIADLYERYIALIGEVIDDEGNTKSDGYVTKHNLPQQMADAVLFAVMRWTNSASRDTAADA